MNIGMCLGNWTSQGRASLWSFDTRRGTAFTAIEADLGGGGGGRAL
jgi:hypothetical protein